MCVHFQFLPLLSHGTVRCRCATKNRFPPKLVAGGLALPGFLVCFRYETSPSTNNMRVAQLGSPTTVGSVRTVACEESNVSNNTYFCPGNDQPQEQQQHNYHPHHRLQEGPTLVIPPHVSTPGQKPAVGVSPSAPVSTDAPSSREHRASGSGQFQRQQRLPSQKDSSDESDDSDDGAQATCQPDTWRLSAAVNQTGFPSFKVKRSGMLWQTAPSVSVLISQWRIGFIGGAPRCHRDHVVWWCFFSFFS